MVFAVAYEVALELGLIWMDKLKSNCKAAISVIINQLWEEVTPSDNNYSTVDSKTDGHYYDISQQSHNT